MLKPTIPPVRVWSLGLLLLFPAVTASAQVSITVDASVTHQTMTGWEATAWINVDSPAFGNFRDDMLDTAVNVLGINRIRLEIRSGVESDQDYFAQQLSGQIDYPTWRSVRYATVNDNPDPDVIDWSGFHFTEMDRIIDEVVLPMKALVEANGERLTINLNYVAFTSQITGGGSYHHDDPAEYAEFVLAAYLHLQSTYGWVPDTWEVLLEPDNVSQWDGTLIGEAMVSVAAVLSTNGFTPRFVAPSNTNMGNAVTYFDALAAVPGALTNLEEICYHRYGGVSDSNLQAIANRAAANGLDSSMLEWWSDSNTHEVLYKDLTMGHNSAWQEGTLQGIVQVDDTNPSAPVLTIPAKTKLTRQYMRWVREGALRIGVTSDDPAFGPLAFVNGDGRTVVVVKADGASDLVVGGLPAGTYGINYSTSTEFDVDLPEQDVVSGGTLTTTVPQRGVITVYTNTDAVDTNPPAKPTNLQVQ